MEKTQEVEIKKKFAHIRDLLEDSLDKAALEIEGIKPNLLSQDLKYEYYFLAGNIHYAKDESDDVILCYNLALKNPNIDEKDKSKCYADLAGAYFDKKLYRDAIYNVERVIQFSRDKKIVSKALTIAGLAYQNLDEFEKAIAQFLKIPEIYNENRTDEYARESIDHAYSSLALNYWQAGRDDLAEKYCNKIFVLANPDARALFWAHINKAHRLYEKKIWTEALEHYNKAMELADDEKEKQFYRKYIVECLERMPK